MLEIPGSRNATAEAPFASAVADPDVRSDPVPPVRMQAVGQLAAGLAHDLNTMLGGIVATAELLAEQVPEGSRQAEDLAAIVGQASRAAELIRQLLAFSRQEMLRPKPVRLGELVSRMAPMLRAQVGRQLGLGLPSERGPLVVADVQALERVILNLVTNARDAIGPRPGRIDIRCGLIGEEAIPEEALSFMPAGRYATLSVADDGPGVPPEHQARIFEPYFTTKPLGAGSGLGLATAYGLVKQSGGFLLLDRSARRGACFTIYLPEAADAGPADPKAAPRGAPAQLLLVEDEAVLRAAMSRALERAGFAVTAVADAAAALDRLADGFEPGLLVTDIRMPGMDGVALAGEARRLRPGLPILLVSGYADAGERDRLGALDVAFLPKPFSLADLCGRAREMLGR